MTVEVKPSEELQVIACGISVLTPLRDELQRQGIRVEKVWRGTVILGREFYENQAEWEQLNEAYEKTYEGLGDAPGSMSGISCYAEKDDVIALARDLYAAPDPNRVRCAKLMDEDTMASLRDHGIEI